MEIPAIARAASGSVMSIVMLDKQGKSIAQGSGFVVGKDGLIVTNYHVIAEGSSAFVKLPGDAFYDFYGVDGVLAADKARDIAIIKAHGQYFRTLRLGNSDRVQVGQEVVAIGNPLSLESTVSNGIVSGVRTIKERGGKFLQITAPISPGSSGGPLFNMAGEVVGITTAGLKGGENLNFAIPINDIKQLLAATDGPWVAIKSFPNEQDPTPKETQSETAQRKPTFEEWKMCWEQSAKVLQKHQLEEKDNPWKPTFGVVSHYDPSTSICYVRISREVGFKREFFIENAFGRGEFGRFFNNWPDEDTRALCYVQPSGEPKIHCKSQAEFDDLAFKYFGISK